MLISTCNKPFAVSNFTSNHQTCNIEVLSDTFEDKMSLEPLEFKEIVKNPDPVYIDHVTHYKSFD